MALDEKQFTELEETFQKHLKDAWSKGMASGVFAVSEVILSYANDKTLTPAKRLQKIRRFCETPLVKRKEEQSKSEEDK